MAEQRDPGADSVASEPVTEAPARKRRLLPMLLVFVPLTLLPAGVGAWFALSQYEDLSRIATNARLHFASDTEDNDGNSGGREYGQFFTLDGIVVNPAESQGKRFLLIDIAMETSSGNVMTELEEKDIVVRDTILKVLASQTVSDLASLESRSNLKIEIRDAVNSLLQRGKVDYLYFTQFVLQ